MCSFKGYHTPPGELIQLPIFSDIIRGSFQCSSPNQKNANFTALSQFDINSTDYYFRTRVMLSFFFHGRNILQFYTVCKMPPYFPYSLSSSLIMFTFVSTLSLDHTVVVQNDHFYCWQVQTVYPPFSHYFVPARNKFKFNAHYDFY